MVEEKNNPNPEYSSEENPAEREPEDSASLQNLPFEEFEPDFLQEMMSENFIEYASYSIKERAIPHIADGLKPVQRRILHSLYEKDDGRYHKVANIIGHTMQYHPHGDMSIGDALVVLANKRYFIDPQGNFGNIYTGDEASASRYIECRLTPLAREVLFNPEITEFIDSYDGRNREPITLPAKIPSLLLLGAEGIAVGMRTRILPHNFKEVLQAQINILKGKNPKVYPDFLTAGTVDVNEYEDGFGKVKVRARIETVNDKTLVIREIPFSTTTESLISSIEEAVRKNKIKISSINDFTAENVEVEITLPRGVYAKETRQQLYAYTDCELNLNSQIIVIKDNRPTQVGVAEVLRHTTEKLLEYLNRELEIQLQKLHDQFHEKSLVRIFIENRIYKRIEECETYDTVVAEVRSGLEPFRNQLKREITDQDIEKLLQIQIRRISRFDLDKLQDELAGILEKIEEVKWSLDNLTEYTINYIRKLIKKYGDQFPRRTEITDLEKVDAREVALRNLKVGHDRQRHFVGTSVRNSNKSEEPLLCSEFDRIIILKGDGSFKVIPVPEKIYAGAIKYFFRAERDQVYCMLYRDRKTRKHYVKKFKIDRYIMEREYRTIPKNCIVEAVYTNRGVVLRGEFKHKSKGAEDSVEIDFSQLEMRSTTARGFKVSDREVASFSQIKRGASSAQTSGENPEGNPPNSGRETTESSDFSENLKPEDTTEKKPEKQAGKEQETTFPQKKTEPEQNQVEKKKKTEKGQKTPKTQSRNNPKREDPENSGPKKSGRILIDEDTPFFLS